MCCAMWSVRAKANYFIELKANAEAWSHSCVMIRNGDGKMERCSYRWAQNYSSALMSPGLKEKHRAPLSAVPPVGVWCEYLSLHKTFKRYWLPGLFSPAQLYLPECTHVQPNLTRNKNTFCLPPTVYHSAFVCYELVKCYMESTWKTLNGDQKKKIFTCIDLSM